MATIARKIPLDKKWQPHDPRSAQDHLRIMMYAISNSGSMLAFELQGNIPERPKCFIQV
jgi:hypothetical protein